MLKCSLFISEIKQRSISSERGGADPEFCKVFLPFIDPYFTIVFWGNNQKLNRRENRETFTLDGLILVTIQVKESVHTVPTLQKWNCFINLNKTSPSASNKLIIYK